MENEAYSVEQVTCPTVDDEAYEPTYAEAFPPLPVPGSESGEIIVASQTTSNSPWSAAVSRMAVRSSVITQVFQVPLEEQKFKEMSEMQFGERGRDQAKTCGDIMSKTGVAIEMSLARDQSLTVVITGKLEGVRKARKMVVMQMQKQDDIQIACGLEYVNVDNHLFNILVHSVHLSITSNLAEAAQTVKIPKEHHRFILGLKGRRLAELELATATKISIPRQEDMTDVITITGTKEGIERARHEIQEISDEQAKLAFVRLQIPKEYHPFICGPNNQILKELQERTGARINIPPASVIKHELTIAGEKDGVQVAEQEISKIFEHKRQTCTTVSVEVKKSQHKYIIGPKGQNLSEILAECGVSVEVPPLDSTSETVTLRGETDKLGIALTNVYAKANSVSSQDIQVDGWLHRFIIGPKGSNIRQMTQDYPKVHVDFDGEQSKITVEGPPEEVDKVVAKINEQKIELMSRMAFVDLKVDPKYHGHIIGRNGANVARIKNATGVSIRIPPDNTKSDIIRIEGTPEGVARAKLELIELVDKMDNEKSRDLMIDQRFHKAIIGQQGAKIKEIRDQFNNVQISFPDPNKQSDVVSLRGPRNEVDKCYAYLQKLSQDMSASSYEVKVKIFKEAHPKIIGKGGAQIKKIREETDTKIDLPRENSDSDVITITGKKENVEKAKNMIEAIQKELANISDITVDVPHKLHTSMIGSKGHLIREIMDDCGGVQIRFPNENSNSDKVHVRGPKAEVEKAKKRLLDLANNRIESGYTATVRVKPEYHGFLIGRGGASIKEFRDRTDTRIIFPAANDADQETITIIGKKENVDKAVKELEEQTAALDNKVERDMRVEPRYHAHFIARRGEVLRQIADECGGVMVSFPRAASKSEKVVLKGSKDCVELAIKRIEDIVADLEAQVTVECIVPRKHHGSIMGPRGQRIQEISKKHNVNIKIPERGADEKDRVDNEPEQPLPVNGHVTNDGDNALVNGGVNGDSDSSSTDRNGGSDSGLDGSGTLAIETVQPTASRRDLVLITGRKDNCEAAKEAILALVPVVVEIDVPFEYHGQLIGQKGKEIRQIMDECEVTITIPKPEDCSNSIKISGPPDRIPRAKQVINERVQRFEEERKQRELRNFRLEVEVASKHHTKLIGRRGAVVNKIRTDYDVQITFPDKDKGSQDVIVIIGLEENAKKARDEILQKAQDLEDLFTREITIDNRIHSRLIGAKGRTIAKLMDEFRVDIRMPGRDASNPDLVVITGREDDVLDCCDHLQNLEEEYLLEVTENDQRRSTAEDVRNGGPHNKGSSGGGNNPTSKGFIVRDAPWSQSYTHNAEDFPNLAASTVQETAPQPVAVARPSWPVKRQ